MDKENIQKIEIKNIGIVLKPKVISDFGNVLPNLTDWLKRRKKNIFFLERDKERIEKIFDSKTKSFGLTTVEKLHKDVDLIITLGGDGTLIGVSRQVTRKSPPIFGVNMGRLGFITEFSKVEFFDALSEALKGKFNLVKRYLYNVEVLVKNKVITKGYFLNDAVISKGGISRMFDMSIDCNEDFIYNLAGDGLIISSPVGSTAYSLAAGGPIIHPDVNSLTLTPVCPHSLTHRPLVLSDQSSILVKPGQDESVISVTLDGQEVIDLEVGSHVRITKSKTRYVQLIKNPERSYFHTLKEKFTHGKRTY